MLMPDASYLYEIPSTGLGSYRILDSVTADLDDEKLDNLRRRFTRALKRWPELDSVTVTIAKKREEDSWFAEADWTNDIVFVPTHTWCPYVTVMHELAHLAIKKLDERDVDVPITSEEFCSILAVARIQSARHIDVDEIFYLGEPDRRRTRWPTICRYALDYREKNHDYVKQCQRWLGIIETEGDPEYQPFADYDPEDVEVSAAHE